MGKKMNSVNIFKIIAAVIITTGAAATMLYLRFTRILLLGRPLSDTFNHEVSYQLLTLGLFAAVLVIVVIISGSSSLKYLRLNSLDGEVIPVPAIGLKVKEEESWKSIGLNFLIVISAVTAVTIFFQVFRENKTSFSFNGVILPALTFAVVNSFIEEGIFRFTIVSIFDQAGAAPLFTALVSGVIFGAVHFFGSPGGIPGVLLAGFLGWLMAKSMLETGSFAWAWIIHACQDVIIFTAKFAVDK